MYYKSLPQFVEALEQRRLLKRVRAEVDPELEITAIVQSLYAQDSKSAVHSPPALLFENVKGSRFPLLINLLGSEQSIELLLNRKPESAGDELSRALLSLQDSVREQKLFSWLWKERSFVHKVLSVRTRKVASAPCKQIKKIGAEVNLREFPIMKCWPKDGGKFITAGLVITRSPKTGARNMGVYRLQLLSRNELILHWQIQKGGGFHYAESESLNEPLEVAVVLGCAPYLWLAGVMPLPEGLDEIAFSGFLSGHPAETVRCETIRLEVPASAEIVIEGIARPKRRALEGPFGDHFGHYSHAADFPVLEVQCVTHRENPIYHSAVVGKPPQEDKAVGECVTKIFTPLIKMMKPELADLWAYYEAGFHNLLVASVRQRYAKEAVKTGLGLLGEGQLSLSKCVILVDEGVNARDFSAVLRAVRDHFDPQNDFILLAGTSQDTLDFTGPRINRGSKMILDATSKESAPSVKPAPAFNFKETLEWRLWEDCLLAVKVEKDSRETLKRVLANPDIQTIKLVACVSKDVDLNSDISLLWGIFTRFDCERDVLFSASEQRGARLICKGPLGIDASWKPEYPEPVEIPQTIQTRMGDVVKLLSYSEPQGKILLPSGTVFGGNVENDLPPLFGPLSSRISPCFTSLPSSAE